MKILVLNGPNLGRLGAREPEVYGTQTLEEIGQELMRAVDGRAEIDVRQTDDEATLIGWLHEAVDTGAHVVINPAAFTHYSYALADAAAMLRQADLALIEVHLTNPHARDRFRQHSVISAVATGVVAGFGATSYRLGVEAILARYNQPIN